LYNNSHGTTGQITKSRNNLTPLAAMYRPHSKFISPEHNYESRKVKTDFATILIKRTYNTRVMVQVNQSVDVGKGYTEVVGGNRKPITSQITWSIIINFTVTAQDGCWKNCCSIITYQ